MSSAASPGRDDHQGETQPSSPTRARLARFLFLASSRRRFDAAGDVQVERLDTVHMVVHAASLRDAERLCLARLTLAMPGTRWSLSLSID